MSLTRKGVESLLGLVIQAQGHYHVGMTTGRVWIESVPSIPDPQTLCLCSPLHPYQYQKVTKHISIWIEGKTGITLYPIIH